MVYYYHQFKPGAKNEANDKGLVPPSDQKPPNPVLKDGALSERCAPVGVSSSMEEELDNGGAGEGLGLLIKLGLLDELGEGLE